MNYPIDETGMKGGEKEDISRFSDVALLIEFKKRFNGSVLYEVQTEHLLERLGLERIKRYLKDGYGLATRKAPLGRN